MSDESYPRLLFLTPCAFNHVTGTGVTFSNLFHGWPKDRLATVTDESVPVTSDVNDNYYFLSDRELRYVEPFCWLQQRARGQQREGASVSVQPRPAWQQLAKKVLGTAGLPERGRLSSKLRRWLDHFQPDLVFSILGSPGYLDLLEGICRHAEVPFVLHVMDHGTIDPVRDGLLRNHLRRTYARRLDRLVPRAASCLAIGEMMAKEYTRRFGRPFRAFQNAIDVARWEGSPRMHQPCARPARLLYIGQLLPYAVLESLRQCCQAVRALNRGGRAVQLEIYTPLVLFGDEARQLAHEPDVRVADVPAGDEAFFTLLQQADALLLPVNFDASSTHYIRLSMPTKLPAYLASGVPILVYGPAEVAQVAYASRHGWGHVVDRPEPALLQQGIREIIANRGLRERLTHTARSVARRFHDAHQVRTEFQQLLKGLRAERPIAHSA